MPHDVKTRDPLHGWDMARITVMARRIIGAHPAWWTEGSYEDHEEAARAGITEALLAADAEPERIDLYRAGQKALHRWVDAEIRYRGRRAVRKFAVYWDWTAACAPSPEHDVLERVILEQEARRAMRLIRGLPRRQREVILALVDCGSYEAAAASMGLGTGTFKSNLTRARAAITALWDSPAGLRDGRCPDCGYLTSAPGHKITCGAS